MTAAHVWHIRVLHPDDAGGIVNAALGGDPEAKLLLAACGAIAQQLSTLTEPDPTALTCLLCSEPLWRGNLPMAAVIITEWDDILAPSIFAICCDCFDKHHADRSALASAVLAGCGARLGEPLRQLPPLVAATGHA